MKQSLAMRDINQLYMVVILISTPVIYMLTYELLRFPLQTSGFKLEYEVKKQHSTNKQK